MVSNAKKSGSIVLMSYRLLTALITVWATLLPAVAEPTVFDQLRKLSDLTADQKKRLQRIETEDTMRVQALQDHIDALQRRIDAILAHPPQTTIYIQNQALPRLSDMRRELAELKSKLAAQRCETLKQLDSTLTVKQLQSLKAAEAPKPIVIDQNQVPTSTTSLEEKPGTKSGGAVPDLIPANSAPESASNAVPAKQPSETKSKAPADDGN